MAQPSGCRGVAVSSACCAGRDPAPAPPSPQTWPLAPARQSQRSGSRTDPAVSPRRSQRAPTGTTTRVSQPQACPPPAAGTRLWFHTQQPLSSFYTRSVFSALPKAPTPLRTQFPFCHLQLMIRFSVFPKSKICAIKGEAETSNP